VRQLFFCNVSLTLIRLHSREEVFDFKVMARDPRLLCNAIGSARSNAKFRGTRVLEKKIGAWSAALMSMMRTSIEEQQYFGQRRRNYQRDTVKFGCEWSMIMSKKENIMKKLAIFLIVLGVVGMGLHLSIAWAGDTVTESPYRAYIDKRIEKCESQAKLAEACTSANLLCDGKIASRQAEYFRDHREELVTAMMKEEVPASPHAMDFFLIRAYFKTAPSHSIYCLR
jgi:hypothetical protein